MDTTNNMWEMECAKQITESHILIGCFSTAQFTPKLIFNVEPTIVFTYKLYKNMSVDVEQTVERLREIYTNPEKVVVLDSLSELQKLVESMEVK